MTIETDPRTVIFIGLPQDDGIGPARKQNQEKETYITVHEIAESTTVILPLDRDYFSDNEKSPRNPKLIHVRGQKFSPPPFPQFVPLNSKERMESLASLSKKRKKTYSLTHTLSPRNIIERSPRPKPDGTPLLEQEETNIISHSFLDDLTPTDTLLAILSKTTVRSNTKKDLLDECQSPRPSPRLRSKAVAKRKKRLKKCVAVLSEGLWWKAKNKEIIRKTTDVTQLLRGQRQFHPMTINGQSHPYLLGDEETSGYDETKPHNREDLPPKIYQFYRHLFDMLADEGYECGPFDREESLNLLFAHQTKKASRAMLKILLSTNMSMWGYCHMELMRMFPRLFNLPYKTGLNREYIGDEVRTEISCDIITAKKKTWVIQKKTYKTSLKAMGMAENDLPIATFTVSWKTLIPKSGQRFKALLSIGDFKWSRGVGEEEKFHFKRAFCHLYPEDNTDPIN